MNFPGSGGGDATGRKYADCGAVSPLAKCCIENLSGIRTLDATLPEAEALLE